MLRIRLIGAISISIVLIGGAIWFRFGQETYTQSNIVAINNEDPILLKETFLAEFASSDAEFATTSTPSKPLNQTDLVSRGLFSDYISLKSQNQATENNLGFLASKYAKDIANTDISIYQVSINKISVVSDSETNLITYSNTVSSIRNKYKNLVIAEHGRSTGLTNPDSLSIYSFMKIVGGLYSKAANELLAVKAPISLAQNHLSLINIYFGNADLLKLFSGAPQDPVPALAALNSYAQNTEKESLVLSNIRRTLQANGIIFNSI